MVQFSRGSTTDLGVQSAWAHILSLNEKRGRKRMTDEQIAAWMVNEFPSRLSNVFRDLRKGELWRVQQARSRYNRGAFSQGNIPKRKSHRYDRNGKRIDPIFSGKAGVRLSLASK